MENQQDLTLACLVHDLNNVFQTLMEAADMLAEDPRSSPVAAAILRSIERGREITLSLQQADQPPATVERVFDNALSLVRDSLMNARGPEIRFERRIEPGLILQRSWAWERVLINLLSNSVRAMPRGGTISVSAARRNGCIEIVVADEGTGIRPEMLPSIFEPHITTKNDRPGVTGLGLHIVKTIVQQEDGEVQAANRASKGAEFTITIPVERRMIRSASA